MSIPEKSDIRIAVSAIVLVGVIVTSGRTDITNGSFEIDGQPSLEGWEWIFAASYQYAPPDGGSWCVGLSGGCVHGVCWQVDDHVGNGEVWRVSCWMRRDIETPYGWGTLGWYVITQDGWENGNFVACDSTDWTFLSVTDTFFLAEGETVGVFIDGGGGFGGYATVYFDLVETERIITVIEENVLDHPIIDSRIRMYRNEPNPFTERTCAQYELPHSSTVYIAIYNLLGREMATLADGEQPAGLHTIIWDATDNSGRKVPSGTYFLRLEAHTGLTTGSYTATRKLCVVR